MRLLTTLVALLVTATPVMASISPSEVVVVYNSNANWNSGARQSKAVADYYCQQRGIPISNQIAVDWQGADESIYPEYFYRYILNDRNVAPNQVIKGLRTQLAERAGLQPGEIPDLATDPTKCIVLCYGVPLSINEDSNSGIFR